MSDANLAGHHTGVGHHTGAAGQPVVIDGGDRSCVQLLLELREHLAALPAGTVVHLLASDPAAPLDLAAWCHLTGHHYLGPIPAAGGTPGYALRVAADARSTRPQAPWHLDR